MIFKLYSFRCLQLEITLIFTSLFEFLFIDLTSTKFNILKSSSDSFMSDIEKKHLTCWKHNKKISMILILLLSMKKMDLDIINY